MTRLLAWVWALAGCDAGALPSRSSVSGLRVLAIRADPPEIQSDQATSIEALVAPDADLRAAGWDEGAIATAWTACVDPASGDPLRCIGREDAFFPTGGLRTVVAPPPDLSPLDATVGIVLHACAGEILAEAVPPVCEGTGAEATFVLRVSENPTNTNPVLAAVRFGGVEVDGDGLSIAGCETDCPFYDVEAVPTDGSDETVRVGDGSRREVLLAAFASDAGTFEAGFDAQAPFVSAFRPPPGSARTRIWIVLHDDRGGVDSWPFLLSTR